MTLSLDGNLSEFIVLHGIRGAFLNLSLVFLLPFSIFVKAALTRCKNVLLVLIYTPTMYAPTVYHITQHLCTCNLWDFSLNSQCSSNFSSEHNKAVAKAVVKESKAHLSNVASSTIQS